MNNKIKILFVMPMYATGGAERLVLHYAKLLDKEKYEVHVASCVEDGELRQKFLELENVNVIVGSRKSDGGRLGAYKKIFSYVKQIQPDIIHTHLLGADFFGFLVKLFLREKISWLVTMHNVEEATSTLRKIVWKYILKKADRIISVSKVVLDFNKKNFCVRDDQSILLMNGVELGPWLEVSMKNIWQSKKIRLATVGRLWEQKGHIYLLQALKMLGDIDLELHIFGDGPLKNFLQEKAKGLGVNGRIIWHGVTPNVVDFLSDIDVVVQPSLWEGLSLVVMEMMSAGRIVITTPAGGDELITPEETGYIVPARDPQALAHSVQYAVSHQDEGLLVAKKARQYARENFDIMKNVAGLEKIYTEVLK